MKNKKKVVAIITARLNSSRLKYKHLLKINNKYMISYLVERLKSITFFDEVIIATTNNSIDDKFENITKKHKIKIFRGSEENVKLRVLQASKKFSADIICNVTGDCPIIDPILIDQMLNIFDKNKNLDMVYYGCFKNYGLPNGMDSCVFTYNALKKSYKMTKKKDEFEHITLHMLRNKKLFKSIFLHPPKNINFPNLSLTLDYYEDYTVIKKIINQFKYKKKFPTCLEIVNFVNRNKLFKINSSLKRLVLNN